MPVGAIHTDAVAVKTAQATVSGNPVRVGNLMGVAEINAYLGQDGNYWTTLALSGSYLQTVSGTLVVGALVFTATAANSDTGVPLTLTATEGTGSKAVYGVITAISQTTGKAFVAPISGNSKGAA